MAKRFGRPSPAIPVRALRPNLKQAHPAWHFASSGRASWRGATLCASNATAQQATTLLGLE